MKIEASFVKLEAIFEFLPSITWYRWGYSGIWYEGSLTFSWLNFGIKIYYHKKKYK
jgi:hypothetical protein